MCGWIKIHRDIAKHWIFQDAEKFKWWIDLIMMASHEDHRTVVGDSIVVIQRGQMSVSLSFLSSRWGRSKEKVLAFLRLLESDNMIKRVADRKSTTITICNYDSYQDVETETPTNVRPMSDQSPTEYKNGKEWKEINNKTNNSACTREESVGWDDSVENSYFERFKIQGSAREVMRVTGKKLDEVMKLLDVYRAKRKMQNRGHKDFYQFCYLFSWAVENNRISLPVQTTQPKVTSNADTLRLMEEMGWRGN